MLSLSVYAQDDDEAEVCYTCNSNAEAIEIHLSEYDSFLNGDRKIWRGKSIPWGKTQSIKTITDDDSTERYYRIAQKPLTYECVLNSKKYTITFSSHWINDNIMGANGMDYWPSVKIIQGKETILPTTILGACNTMQSSVDLCNKQWAISVFLYLSDGKPIVSLNRFTEEFIH